jgi:hypothetical protein
MTVKANSELVQVFPVPGFVRRHTVKKINPSISCEENLPVKRLHEQSKLPDVENVQRHVTACRFHHPRFRQKLSSTPWKEFQYQDHTLRINASEISAVTGFHFAKVLMSHVYQGRTGKELKDHDANLLGIIIMISEDQVRQTTIRSNRNGKVFVSLSL